MPEPAALPWLLAAAAAAGAAPPVLPASAAWFDEDRLAADVAHLAVRPRDGQGPREAARAWLGVRLAELGYAVAMPEVAGGDGRNVIGLALGEGRAEESIVVAAHLDTVAGSPGADVNASGLAAVLAVAAAQAAAGPAPRSLIIALWDLEEQGLAGSAAWALAARAEGRRVVDAVTLGSVGYRDARPLAQSLPWSLALTAPRTAWRLFRGGRRGDFIALVGNDEAPLAGLAAAAAGLPTVGLVVPGWLVPLARRSELWRFAPASLWDAGFAATMLTDTAHLRNPNDHRPADLPGTLDLAFLADTARLVDRYVEARRREAGRGVGDP